MTDPDPDGNEDADEVGVRDKLGVGDVSGDVLGARDVRLAVGAVLVLALTVGRAVVWRCVGVRLGVDVVTIPTTVGVGSAGGRTCT